MDLVGCEKYCEYICQASCRADCEGIFPGSGTCLLYVVVVVMIMAMMMIIINIIIIIIIAIIITITIMITNLHSFYPLPCTSVEPCGTHVFIYLGALEPYHLAMAVSRSQGLCLVLESRRQQVRIKPAFIFKPCKSNKHRPGLAFYFGALYIFGSFAFWGVLLFIHLFIYLFTCSVLRMVNQAPHFNPLKTI